MDINQSIRKNRELLEKLFSENTELKTIKDEFLEDISYFTDLNSRSIIATGHQPVPYYPGILCKNYFVGKYARDLGVKGINFVVDTDQNKIEVPVPCKQKGAYCKEMITLKADNETVLSEFAVSQQKVSTFLQQIKERTSSLNRKDIQSAFENWKRKFLKLFHKNNSFVDSLILARFHFEKELGIEVQNIKISYLTDTYAYYHFVWYIVKYIHHFRASFNEAVENWSTKTYQPVKFLEEEDGWIELPFWYISEGKRYPIWVKKVNRTLQFASYELDYKNSFGIEDFDDPVQRLRDEMLLYPKATTLTMMLRLFLSDLFVHGTGAVEYEGMNNEFMQKFFSMEQPLQFYTVTGNMYLPLLDKLPDYEFIKKQAEHKQKWLKEAERNPEDLIEKGISGEYKEQKKKLAKKLRESGNAEERKTIHQQLEKLDEEMKRLLNPDIRETRKDLANLNKILEKHHIFYDRQYPYFIYPPEYLTAEQFDANMRVEQKG